MDWTGGRRGDGSGGGACWRRGCWGTPSGRWNVNCAPLPSHNKPTRKTNTGFYSIGYRYSREDLEWDERRSVVRIRIWLFRWFRIQHEFFSSIFGINFTFVSPSLSCVSASGWKLDEIQYKLIGFFLSKKELIFFNWTFCWKIVTFYQFVT
jgi:hypothetical protein